jgi:TetR/AcrR family transcriptional regulator
MKERARQILDAADELFGERGFAAVSVRDVAVRAEVKKATVFYYFDSKEDLFEQVLERYYTAHRAAFEDAFSTAGPLRERLHGVLDAYIDFIEANQRYPRLVQNVITGSPDHHPLIERNLRLLYSFVSEAMADTAPESGPLAARHLFVTLSGAVINTYTYGPVLAPMWGSDPLAPESLAERRVHLHWLVDTMLDSMQASAAPD